MSMKLDATLVETGTRFRLFPQPRFLSAFSMPETIRVSAPPNIIQSGPADERMYVVDAINKLPYSRFNRPQYKGEKNPPVKADSTGHFDQIDTGSREFSCATMYATVRRVLDIWEDYFGRRIEWHFKTDFDSLELIPLIVWNNAQSGYGFLEFGFGSTSGGEVDFTKPYCQNFDVLAHELGHSIIFAEVGVPVQDSDEGIDYGGMHESAGDLVAIISSLHFHSVLDHLLEETKGNLFTVNELNRVGELSNSREIRVAFNSIRMSDVGDEPHDRSLPLTGGIFDIMVEVFQKELVSRELIGQDLATRSTHGPSGDTELESIQEDFASAYEGHGEKFKESLLIARDYLGQLLAKTWKKLSPNFLTYHDIVRALLSADRELSGGKHQQTIRECIAWREISVPENSLLLGSFRISECSLGGQIEGKAALFVKEGRLGRMPVSRVKKLEKKLTPGRVRRIKRR